MIALIHGEDTRASRAYLNELSSAFKKKHGESGTIVSIDASEEDPARIVDHVSSGDLFGGPRLVVAHSFLETAAAREALGEYLDAVAYVLPSSVSLCVYHSGGADGRLKLVQRLKKEEFSKEFAALGAGQINALIAREAARCGVSFDSGAQELFASYVGENSWRVASELEKLSYMPHKRVSKRDIEILVHRHRDQVIWGFIDALCARDKKQIFNELDALLASGERAEDIASMLVRQVRLLMAFQSASGDVSSLAHETHLKPFVVQKTKNQARRFSLAELQGMMLYLTRVERAIKREYKDPVILMTLFIDTFIK